MSATWQHELYPSVDEMLRPDGLSTLAGEVIQQVRCLPFQSKDAFSGSQFLAIETNQGHGPRYILKRTSWELDKFMRATKDYRCRSVTLWQSGLLDRLEADIDHAIVACAWDEKGWALLMRDMTGGITTEFQPVSIDFHTSVLEAMAAMHASFWNAPELMDPTLGLCTLSEYIDATSLRRAKEEPVERHRILDGWSMLLSWLDPDVAETLSRLCTDWRPFCEACSRFPWTLVHGDLKLGNLGLTASHGPKVVVLDWQFATIAPATIDLAWYLNTVETLVPLSYEASTAYYRRSLERRLGKQFDETWWQSMLDLGMLGHILRFGWVNGWYGVQGSNKNKDAIIVAQAMVRIFNHHVRGARRWL